MKNTILLLFFALFITPTLMVAQIVVQQGFEENACSNPNENSFYLECHTNWISSSATPSINDVISAYQGNSYAHMYHKYEYTPGSSARRGEGIILNFNFNSGETYKITFAARGNTLSSPYTAIRQVVAVPGSQMLPNNTGSSGSNGEIVPAIPSNAAIIHNISYSNNQWTLNEITFTPNSNYAQLWIRGENLSSTINGQITTLFYVDDFSIETCPKDFGPDFHFEHTNGVEDDMFSSCEKIMLDGSASSSSTYQRIRLRDLTANTEVVTPWLGTLPLSSPFDLIDYIESNYPSTNLDFIAGHTYQVKLSIYENQICNWKHDYETFEIIDEVNCNNESDLTACAKEGDYGFILLDCAGSGNDYYWKFPINSTAILLPSQNGIVQASEGEYTVIVTDECGAESEFVFEIVADCCDEVKKCESPDIFGCDTTIDGNGTETVTFYWESIPDAVDGYEIQIGLNGCCDNGPGLSLAPIVTNQTQYSYTPPSWVECFTWTVRSICDEQNEVYSDNNQTYCYTTKNNTCFEIESPQLKISERNSQNQDAKYTVYPNPNNGEHIITNFSGEAEMEIVVELFNIQGQLVKKINGKTDQNGSFQKSLNLNTYLENGMYTVLFHTSSGSFSRKLIVAKN